MGDHVILSCTHVEPMDTRQLIANLLPGDRLDIDEIPLDKKADFLDELEGQGYLLSTDGKVGILEECSVCGGTAELDGAECGCCEGYSLLVSYGRGWAPWKG